MRSFVTLRQGKQQQQQQQHLAAAPPTTTPNRRGPPTHELGCEIDDITREPFGTTPMKTTSTSLLKLRFPLPTSLPQPPANPAPWTARPATTTPHSLRALNGTHTHAGVFCSRRPLSPLRTRHNQQTPHLFFSPFVLAIPGRCFNSGRLVVLIPAPLCTESPACPLLLLPLGGVLRHLRPPLFHGRIVRQRRVAVSLYPC